MLDLLYLTLTLAFFAISLVLVNVFERMRP